ncbi:MAG: hypothetical protein WEA56_08225 [Balneolaceae bacterium]
MKKGVSHIFQKTIVTVLLAGFIAHLALPFSSKAQKTAFTQWLDHNVVSTGDDNEIRLRNSIRQLPEQTSDFSVLLEKASELIANNKDEFRIQPFAPAGDQNEVTSWLVGQWNVFQHQKAENNAVFQDRLKNLPDWTFSNTAAGYLSWTSLPEFPFLKEIAALTLENPVRNFPPLVSGISINAP